MSSEEESNSELLVRIDERVNTLCEKTDRLLKQQGELETRVQSNESDIEVLDEDVNRLGENVNSVNRNVIVGALMTIATVLVTAYLTGALNL